MRIAHLSSMTGYYGGEVLLASLATGMRERGHEVWAIARPRSALAERLAACGVPVRTQRLVDWYEPLGMLRLAAWLRRKGIEILHTHLPRDYFTAAVATLGTGIANVGSRHQLRPLSHAPLKRPFLRGFAAMLPVSEAARAGFLASGLLPSARVTTVPNGIALPARPADRGTMRAALGVEPGRPVVGFVGSIGPHKGLDTLLAVAARLRARYPDLCVAVLGAAHAGSARSGDLADGVARLGLERTVRLLGYRADAAALCAGFDVQVVPSVAEPFGLVVLEAMAQGVPVVATDAGGIPEIIRDGREGYLVPVGDDEILAARVASLLDDAELRSAMGARGRDRVAARYTRERMLDRIEAVYRVVLDAAGGRRSRPFA
jgi:glycosyltransferase involved in cell wall biosynthesis